MTDDAVLQVRDDMSAFWHSKAAVWHKAEYFTFTSKENYEAFCVAKDLIQDSGEALLAHRKTGFSASASLAYIEFWGVLQAIFIQQGAIKEMWKLFDLKPKELPVPPAWEDVRVLRNLAAGHPVAEKHSGNGLRRSVTSRTQKSYSEIKLTVFSESDERHQVVNLGAKIDCYDAAAALIMAQIFDKLRQQIQGYET